MPAFVHLTSEHASRRIKRSGIRNVRGVYCLPIVPNYYVSHQWLRELKRRGQRIIMGVYFTLPDEETVWFGHFGGPHETMMAAQAVERVLHSPGGLGLEIIVPRAIRPDEIRAIRALRQVIGWRYKPDAHGTRPCPCPWCQRGAVRSRKIRARYERWNDAYRKAPYPSLLEQLREAAAVYRKDGSSDEACEILHEIRYRKAGVATDLVFLMDYPDDDVVQYLAITLGRYREPAAHQMLIRLCEHASDDVRESAADSLLELYKDDALPLLAPFIEDDAVARAIAEHDSSYNGLMG